MVLSYYRDITVDHTKVQNTDQTNFPMWFDFTHNDLRTTGNGGNVTSSSGFDIVFKNADGSVQLDHQIIKYVPATGEFEGFIRLPTASTSVDTVIRIYYGDSSITTSQENVAGVWNSNFKGVWHSDDNAANTTVDDSTSNGYDLTSNTNTSTKTVAGKLNNALSYAGTAGAGDYLKRAYNADLNPAQFTVRAWIYVSGGGGNFRAIASSRDGSNGTNTKGWIFYVHPDGYITGWTGIGGSGWDNINGTTNLSADTWYLCHFTYNGTTSAVYVNGTSEGSGTKTYVQNTTYELRVGAGENENATPGFWFNGRLDEVWISNTARSADWIKTEYNNQNSPSTFYSVGSQQNNAVHVSKKFTARFYQVAATNKKFSSRFYQMAGTAKKYAARFFQMTGASKLFSARFYQSALVAKKWSSRFSQLTGTNKKFSARLYHVQIQNKPFAARFYQYNTANKLFKSRLIHTVLSKKIFVARFAQDRALAQKRFSCRFYHDTDTVTPPIHITWITDDMAIAWKTDDMTIDWRTED